MTELKIENVPQHLRRAELTLAAQMDAGAEDMATVGHAVEAAAVRFAGAVEACEGRLTAACERVAAAGKSVVLAMGRMADMMKSLFTLAGVEGEANANDEQQAPLPVNAEAVAFDKEEAVGWEARRARRLESYTQVKEDTHEGDKGEVMAGDGLPLFPGPGYAPDHELKDADPVHKLITEEYQERQREAPQGEDADAALLVPGEPIPFPSVVDLPAEQPVATEEPPAGKQGRRRVKGVLR